MSAIGTRTRRPPDPLQKYLSNDEIKLTDERTVASKKVSLFALGSDHASILHSLHGAR